MVAFFIMYGLIVFYAIVLTVAIAMQYRLSDRCLVRMVGTGTLMMLVPSLLFMTETFNWRTTIAREITVTGGVLLTPVGLGALLVIACSATAAIRTLDGAVRYARAKKVKK